MRFSHRRDEKTDKLPEFVKGLAFLRKGVYNNIYTSQYRIRYCAFLTGYEPSGAGGRRCFHVVFAHQLGGVNVASDLHCHTKISDGSMGIEELIAIAKRRGLSAISVTDHDTTAAATRAVIIGRRQEVRVIHGVEFSTIDKARGNVAHLLCYLCDTPDRLEGLCRRTGESRRQAAMAMVRKVMRYYPITPELIVKCATGSTNIYKQHIMHALMDAGYADSIYGELYQKLFSPETGSALVEPEYPDVKEVLELIHSAGGIAVLAHPVPYRNEELLEELTGLGLDGVEVWHPDQSETDSARLAAFAAEHGLLTTGGSDFHGMYTPAARPLGSTAAPDECVEALLAFKDKKKRKNA